MLIFQDHALFLNDENIPHIENDILTVDKHNTLGQFDIRHPTTYEYIQLL